MAFPAEGITEDVVLRVSLVQMGLTMSTFL